MEGSKAWRPMEGFNAWWPMEGSKAWWPMEGSKAWWPMEGSNVWWPLKGSNAWWPLKGFNVRWPMEEEGEIPFHLFPLSSQQILLKPSFLPLILKFYFTMVIGCYLRISFLFLHL